MNERVGISRRAARRRGGGHRHSKARRRPPLSKVVQLQSHGAVQASPAATNKAEQGRRGTGPVRRSETPSREPVSSRVTQRPPTCRLQPIQDPPSSAAHAAYAPPSPCWLMQPPMRWRRRPRKKTRPGPGGRMYGAACTGPHVGRVPNSTGKHHDSPGICPCSMTRNPTTLRSCSPTNRSLALADLSGSWPSPHGSFTGFHWPIEPSRHNSQLACQNDAQFKQAFRPSQLPCLATWQPALVPVNAAYRPCSLLSPSSQRLGNF